MSRSNPTENNPNPSTRWFEWAGGNDGGFLRYYDKEKKENIPVPLPFTFLLLDELSCVKGWHDASDSGIFSNEVKDTKQDVMIVRAFKGGDLAEGVYSKIRDRIGAMGGHFVASCYLAYRDGNELKIGNIGFKGAALNSWVEFKKACKSKTVNGKSIRGHYADAVCIVGFDEGTKGRITYRTPQFALKPISEESNAQAVILDVDLQAYLATYLARPKVEQAQTAKNQLAQLAGDDAIASQMAATEEFPDDSIPF